jgi:hypothetical protein
MCGRSDDDPRKIATCWRGNDLIIKLHIGTAHLFGYVKAVYDVLVYDAVWMGKNVS